MRLGICHVPEGREVFPFLTVHENLLMGAYTRRDKDAVHHDLELCFAYFPVLKERAHQRAGLLSGGEQQMLSISRALMGRPKLLLLDEPSLGLSPLLVTQIFRIIRRINQEQGVAILLVEQNAHMALQTADFGYVLEVGRIVLADDCVKLDAVRRNQGILSRPEGSRRPRAAPLEEEAAVALNLGANPDTIPALVANTHCRARRRDHFAQEEPRYLEGGDLVRTRHAHARSWHGAEGGRLRARRCRVRAGRDAAGIRLCRSRDSGAGGVSAAIHPEEEAEALGEALRQSDCRVLFVENEEQLDKALSVRDRCPALQRIVIFEMKGLRDFADPMCESFQLLAARGADHDRTHPDDWQTGIAAIANDQPAVLLLPNGGGTAAKGRVLTHGDALHLLPTHGRCWRHGSATNVWHSCRCAT